MDDANKKPFWLMINITMELTNHPPLTKEAIVAWWHKLKQYDFDVVQKAVDEWLDASNKTPTPHDIKSLCKPKKEIYTALPAPLNRIENMEYSKEVVQFIAEQPKKKSDKRAWINRILENPKKFPDISMKYAQEALLTKETA
jgi:acyl-CoA thioesterase